MKKIDPDKVVEIVGAIIIVIYIIALWLYTTPVSACILNAGISKQLNEYEKYFAEEDKKKYKECFN